MVFFGFLNILVLFNSIGLFRIVVVKGLVVYWVCVKLEVYV